jgi:hypothetical protein
MAFSGNNQTLYNAALNGALAGMMSGRMSLDATIADYASVGAAATAYAAKVDSLIAADPTLTAAGATLVPASAANQQNFNAKSSLMHHLSAAIWRDRAGTDTTSADYASMAAAVVAQYNEGIAQYALAPGGTSLS